MSPLEIAKRNERQLMAAQRTLQDMAARKEAVTQTAPTTPDPMREMGWSQAQLAAFEDGTAPDGSQQHDRGPRHWGAPHNTMRVVGKSTQKSQRAGSDRRAWEHGVGR